MRQHVQLVQFHDTTIPTRWGPPCAECDSLSELTSTRTVIVAKSLHELQSETAFLFRSSKKEPRRRSMRTNVHMYRWFLFLLLGWSLSASAQKNDALALTHITVIDCTGAAPKPNSTVIITGTRLTAVGPNASASIPAAARVVDGSGRFLIPGLWDMHGHLTDATADARYSL